MTTSGEIGVEDILDYFRSSKTTKVVHENVTATGGYGIINQQKEAERLKKQLHVPSYKKPADGNYFQRFVDKEKKEMIHERPFLCHDLRTCTFTAVSDKCCEQTNVNIVFSLYLRCQAFGKHLKRTTIDLPEGVSSHSLFSVEEVSSFGTGIPDVNDLQNEESMSLYRRYYTQHKYDPNLAITQFKERIVNMIEAYQVIVIQGATGCGKTTQVPQYILDHYVQTQRHCNIVVTQPRRIAAISIANRVCQERGWNLGHLVGYQVGMDRSVTENTRLTYMTTGVLLQKLVKDKRMDSFTHVIIDEVHERDQDTDFALLVVRKFLRSVSRGVKVILMSATFDTDLFAKYFSMPLLNKLERAPVISVEGKAYTVTEFYLNDLTALGGVPELDIDAPNIPVESYELAAKLIKMFDRIEIQEMDPDDEAVNNFAPNRGTVLVFLPGIFEIQEMEENLRKICGDFNISKWWILPLHSTITTEEQRRVFIKPQPGMRKIILSTNIAESSITVPDIKYVIDFCLTKHLVCDRETHYTCLQLNWASKANCTQRRGRAGRVSTGRVYRMITKHMYDLLPDYEEPEMARCPLENTVLNVKLLDLGEPKSILALALQPPDLPDIERTVILLKEAGALSMMSASSFNPHDGDLTFIGKVMANLPLDIKLSRLIVYGYCFGCLESCIVMASSMSSKTFFSRPFRHAHKAYKAKCQWAYGSFSDLITALNVYQVWQSMKANGSFNRPGGERENTWCRRNFIQLRPIRDVELMVEDLERRLSNFGICAGRQSNNSSEDMLVLKLVICGALYPNYFLCEKKNEPDIHKELNGLPPHCSIGLAGLPQNAGLIYSNAIKSILQENCQSDVKLYFEGSKAYAEFLQSTKDKQDLSQIHPAVYYAVKMRQLRIPIELTALSPDEAAIKMQQIKLLYQNSGGEHAFEINRMAIGGVSNNNQNAILPNLPELNVSIVQLHLTHVNDCSHFWAQECSEDNQERLRHIYETIKRCKHEPAPSMITPGMIVLAPFTDIDCTEHYRARVEAVVGSLVEVLFIDYGNSASVQKSELLSIDPAKAPSLMKTPAMAMECMLAEIRPSAVKDTTGKWTEAAKRTFISFVNPRGTGYKLYGRVYSVIQQVVRLELVRQHEDEGEISINQFLISRGFAEKAGESYLSKQNHKLRENACETLSMNNLQSASSSWVNFSDIKLPEFNIRTSKNKFKLKGPSSPLEIGFYAMTRSGCAKSVRVDSDSVNSVSLDPEAWDEHQKLLVAAHVDLSSSLSTIKARGTTLMPNIHGLPALMSLIFAPKVELRTDPGFRRYTGAICGLGVDEKTECPFYPDHDIEVTFDVMITTDDIIAINGIRIALNIVLSKDDEISRDHLSEIQKRVRDHLLRVISKHRESCEPLPFRNPFRWNQIPESRILTPAVDNNMADCPYVLPLHNAIELRDAEEERIKLIDHIKKLRTKAETRSYRHEVIVCDMCKMTLYSCRDLALHLNSTSHMQKEEVLMNSLQNN